MRPFADKKLGGEDSSRRGTRLRYGPYLAWWCGTWMLTTVLTQLPECYERSYALAFSQQTTVFGELLGFAGSRSVIELVFGLLWGSLSWLLQWGFAALSSRWPRMAPVVLLACMEGVLFGLPLTMMNTSWANDSLAGNENEPLITISAGSITAVSIGTLLAFPLACLVAGRMAASQPERDAGDD